MSFSNDELKQLLAGIRNLNDVGQFKIGMLNQANPSLSDTTNSAQSEEQFREAIADLNRLCDGQISFDAAVKTKFSPSDMGLASQALLEDCGVHAIVGVLSSSRAQTISNVPGGVRLHEYIQDFVRPDGDSVAYAEARATSDEMTSTLDGSNNIVSGKPLKNMIRTTTTSSNYGEAAYNCLVNSTGPLGVGSLSGMTVKCVNDGTSSSSFQNLGTKKFADLVRADIGAGMKNGPGGAANPAFQNDQLFRDAVTAGPTDVTALQAFIEDELLSTTPGVTGSGPVVGEVPDIIGGVWLDSGDYVNFHAAWEKVAAGNSPAITGSIGYKMNEVKFVHTASFAGVQSVSFSLNTGNGVAAEPLMTDSSRFLGVQPWFDVTRTGFKRWDACHQNDPEILWDKTPRAYDSCMIVGMSLIRQRLLKAAGRSKPLSDIMKDICNPNGLVVYASPEDNSIVCNRLRTSNDDSINYEGAASNCNVENNGDLSDPIFFSYTINDSNGGITEDKVSEL